MYQYSRRMVYLVLKSIEWIMHKKVYSNLCHFMREGVHIKILVYIASKGEKFGFGIIM